MAAGPGSPRRPLRGKRWIIIWLTGSRRRFKQWKASPANLLPEAREESKYLRYLLSSRASGSRFAGDAFHCLKRRLEPVNQIIIQRLPRNGRRGLPGPAAIFNNQRERNHRLIERRERDE